MTFHEHAYHFCRGMKHGGWSHLWMLNTLKVSSRSLGSRSMFQHYSMDIKLSRRIQNLMPKMLKFILIYLKVSIRKPFLDFANEPENRKSREPCLTVNAIGLKYNVSDGVLFRSEQSHNQNFFCCHLNISF